MLENLYALEYIGYIAYFRLIKFLTLYDARLQWTCEKRKNRQETTCQKPSPALCEHISCGRPECAKSAEIYGKFNDSTAVVLRIFVPL